LTEEQTVSPVRSTAGVGGLLLSIFGKWGTGVEPLALCKNDITQN